MPLPDVRPEALRQAFAHEVVHFRDLAQATACARCRSPRPARRRRQPAPPSRPRAPSRRAGRRCAPASRRRRARPRSRRCRSTARSPARQAASALRATSASVSPWSARRSEWPDDHRDRAGLRQHLGGEVAGMRPVRLRVAVLPADPERPAGEAGDQRRRREDQHVAAGRRMRCGELGQHVRRGGAAVHLPVSGDELAAGHGRRFLKAWAASC